MPLSLPLACTMRCVLCWFASHAVTQRAESRRQRERERPSDSSAASRESCNEGAFEAPVLWNTALRPLSVVFLFCVVLFDGRPGWLTCNGRACIHHLISSHFGGACVTVPCRARCQQAGWMQWLFSYGRNPSRVLHVMEFFSQLLFWRSVATHVFTVGLQPPRRSDKVRNPACCELSVVVINHRVRDGERRAFVVCRDERKLGVGILERVLYCCRNCGEEEWYKMGAGIPFSRARPSGQTHTLGR